MADVMVIPGPTLTPRSKNGLLEVPPARMGQGGMAHPGLSLPCDPGLASPG